EKAFIRGADARHLCQVLRTAPGTALTVCDGQGYDYEARVTAISPEEVCLEVISKTLSVSEPSVSVTLYVGYPKADKLEWIVQKAVELGAAHIVPFFSRYCVAAPKKEEQKNLRYNRIAYEAAKQSGRGRIPEVGLPLSFPQLLGRLGDYDTVLFCYEAACSAVPLHSRLAGAERIAIVTGAEGGFSDEEAAAAKAVCGESVSLGPRILRCETAPIAVLSAVMALTGNLQ
ncbi:MAG: RsmE family RNA methyltransferase, partial [Oscillospiraceae bacterium]|nr:RsmE family RNA methyltransferase [Oscillospiraceae bacterium]